MMKQSNIIKLTIEGDTIRHNKKFTRVLELSGLKDIVQIINRIGKDDNFKLEDSFKLIINFHKNEYYVLQTTNKELAEVDDNEISTEFIMEMYKKFFSVEKINYDAKKMKNNRKIRKEVAPYKFKVTNSYIEEDRGYCAINIIENVSSIKDIINIINEHDIWLIVDLNKIDQKKILDTVTKMEENNFEKVKIDKFIKNHIYELKEKLKNEDIIQSEFKMLHYNEDLNLLKENNVKLLNKLMAQGISAFMVNERLNLIKAFNSSIYPYTKLNVTQSINKSDFITLIGG